ncbi:MAG: c-type cytochrome biogenesis protein CcmI [Hyphomicrobiales bacterium]
MLIWLIFALFTAAALLAVLLPLARERQAASGRAEFDAEIYRDQLQQIDAEAESGLLNADEAEAARIEVSRRLLATAPGEAGQTARQAGAGLSIRRAASVFIVIMVPALSLAVYLFAGSPNLPGQPFAARQELSPENQDIGGLVAKVERHLRANPRDGRGWRIIAPAYLQLRRYRDAAAAYAHSLDIEGRNAEVLTNYGEALVLAEQGLVTEAARKAFAEAERMDAKMFKARFFLGLAARQDGDTEGAIARWRSILKDGPKDAQWRPVIEAHISDAGGTVATAPQLSREDVDAARDMTADEQREMIEGMVARLASRLDQDGSDLNGWLRLVQAYVVLGKTDKARGALDKAATQFAGDQSALTRIEETRNGLGLKSE